MYLLRHSNCDNRSGSTWNKWKTKPTKEQLTHTLSGYHDDADELNEIVAGLLTYGEHDVESGDCTHYELEEV
jgi:hypothetical protein